VGALERYRRVLRAPHITRLWVCTTIARLPIGINSLAIVLSMRAQTGSFSAAGLAAGLHALAFALANPFQGRIIDRRGPRGAVPQLIAFHACTMVLFIVLLPVAPAGVLVVIAALAGLGQPAWSAILRAMWPRLLRSESLVTTAFALDSTLMELVFVAGPLLVAAAVAVASPQAALVASVALVVLGTTLLLASPAVRAWEPEIHDSRGPFGALVSPGLRTLVLASIPIGLAFGAFEISLPAFAEDHGNRGDAGVLIALWAVGSGVGGLAYGAREWHSSLVQRWLVLSPILAVALLVPVVSGSMVAMALLLLPAGALIAPTLATSSQLLGVLAPPGMSTEAYSWGPTALVIGVSAGNALGGAVIEGSGWAAAVVLAAAAAALGATIALGRRASLQPV
jgi:MFS family permease